VSIFKYLGNIITNGSRNDNYFKGRIQFGNRAYFANLKTLKSKKISRTSKVQVYKILIRPAATYRAETCMLTVTEENALRMYERKIISRVYRPCISHEVKWNYSLWRRMYLIISAVAAILYNY
jgi:hypothetical protein